MPVLSHRIEQELESLCRSTSSDFTALSFAEYHDPRIRWKYVFGNRSERYNRMVVKPGLGPAGLALRTGKPAVWSDNPALASQRAIHCPLVSSEWLHTAAAVPLDMGKGVSGVLLAGRRSTQAYQETELTALNESLHTIKALIEAQLESKHK